MDKLLDRFLRYVKIDTASDDVSGNHPSTPGQIALAGILAQELQDLGITNITTSQHGYLMAELPANTSKALPAAGFLAHLDTSPEVSGQDVKPQVFYNYDGGALVLNQSKSLLLCPQNYPELNNYIGRTIITSDGTTLLGADDKAGIAIIMTVLARIANKPDFEHGKIMVAFTPDEEIGQGADYFDVARFGADFAYTIDGGPLGELEYETFNAAMAQIDIQGINVHPGTAYLRMKNAMLLAMEFNAMLPAQERPEFTREYQGFYHLTKLEGTVEKARMSYIIRDHDKGKFNLKKDFMQNCIDFLNQKYGESVFKLTIKDQYYNMREKIEPVFHIVDLAQQAMLDMGVKPVIKPVRGGTDGARLSFMGLPCPNIFTGGHNFHSRYEFVCLESMEAAAGVIARIIELIAMKNF
ncbi:MAG: peptidase T [Syntrophomonadaceae bacterium]|nr:peptidase T [Syntrophomonadaceae bacterium]